MWKYNYTDELYHYGVLGMKWGKRKARYEVSDKELSEFRKKKMAESQLHGVKVGSVGWWKNAPKATIIREYEAERKQQAKDAKRQAKDKRSEDSKNVAQIRKKKVNQMTNKELREANDRLELERRYVDLSSKRVTGQKVVQAFIATGMTLGTIEVAARNYKKAADFVIDKLGKRVVR